MKAHLTILRNRQLEDMGSMVVAKGTLISAAAERYVQELYPTREHDTYMAQILR